MNYEQMGDTDTPINLVIVFTVVLTLLAVALILDVLDRMPWIMGCAKDPRAGCENEVSQ